MTLATGNPTVPPLLPDRLSAAVAEVDNMRNLIQSQRDRIEEMQRDLARERDRVSLLTEERARWRTDAMACRTFVVKLATILEHVNTATEGAAHILTEMALMDSEETSTAAYDETKELVQKNLDKLRTAENGSTVETLSERAPADAG